MYTIGILPVYEACLIQQLPRISPDSREDEGGGYGQERPPSGAAGTGRRWISAGMKPQPAIRGKVLMRDPPHRVG
ncbi:hypothetical protein ACFQ49_16945 [Kroppenstedtia eburnea]|uniref:hypothetical protein n=1 Tax=Kroppenstedtia eburnea TaxID=714067 RepID=UPI0036267A5A